MQGGGALGLPTYFTLPGGGIEGVHLAEAFSQINFTSSQVGTSLNVRGAAGLQALHVSDLLVSGSTSVDASGWTLLDWTAGEDYMQFYGNGDVNTIKGSAGDDLITGGAGQDSLQGGAGNDTYIYFSHETHGAEVLSDSGGTDEIDLQNAGTFDFTGFGPILGIAALTFNAAQTATFHSSTALSVFPSLAVTGATGAQTLYLKPVTISSTASTIEDYSNFTFSNWTSGTDIVKIDGTFGANMIGGTSEADHIWGDNGADEMTGGGGADRFLYGNEDHSLFATPDVINNFSGAGLDGDKIDLSALASAIGDPFSLTGSNGSDPFSGNGSPEVRYQSAGATIEVLIDIDGDTGADMKIVIASGLFTAHLDIILA